MREDEMVVITAIT